MTKDRTTGGISLIISVALHALLLLIPWQPARTFELLPLEGKGVMELAAIAPAKGNPEQIATEAEPEQDLPKAKQAPAKEPSKTTVAQKQAATAQAAVAPKELVKPKAEVVSAESGKTPVSVAEANKAEEPGSEAMESSKAPMLPMYPGDDPTGEAMVASKRAPAYPKESMSAASEGDVVVVAIIAENGAVISVEAIKPADDTRLTDIAVRTVRTYWTFKPAEKRYKVTIEVSFRMVPVAEAKPRFISASFVD